MTEELGPAGPEPRVLVVVGRSALSAHPLPDRGSLVLGRSRAADVVIDDRSVSRRHARLTLDGRRVAIADLDSATHAHRTSPGRARRSRSRRRAVSPGRGHAGHRRRQRRDAAHRASPQRPTMPSWRRWRRAAAGNVACSSRGGPAGKEGWQRHPPLSARAIGPFFRLNCAAIAESLLESRALGHERGPSPAPRGQARPAGWPPRHAVLRREVLELPLALQVKLLLAVGSERAARGRCKARPVPDVRYVSASTLARGRGLRRPFRRDLYYRWCTVHPPARSARRDPPSVLRFGPINESSARPVPLRHAWPAARARLAGQRRVCARLRAGCCCATTGPAPRSRPGCGPARAPDLRPGPRRRSMMLRRPAPRRARSGDRRRTDSLRDAARRESRRSSAAASWPRWAAGGNQTRAASLGISRRTLVNRSRL